jgi:membrane-bound lytic murein transglycosylase D
MTGPGRGARQGFVLCALVLALGACAGRQSRPDADSAPPPTTVAQPAETTMPVDDALSSTPTITAHSPWERLRARFAMPGCDSSTAATQQAQRYVRSANRFSASLEQALPLLILVLDELEQRELPGELALLPYIESHYRLVAGKPGGPAGMWQLMPRTATAHGLRLDGTFDERLDPIASTRVALDLLQGLHERFGDWRLAVMAYNTGEFRLKAALGKTRTGTMSNAELSALKLSPITHQHLARLLALACVVAEPERFGVELPPATETDALEVVALSDPVDLRLAARLAGLTDAEFSRYNAAASRRGTVAAASKRILLPKPRVERFRRSLSGIPQDRRDAWHILRIGGSTTLAGISAQLEVTPAVLAVANDLDADAVLRAGQDLLVPGVAHDVPVTARAGIHVVRQGDTLSRIAQRYGVRLVELLHWNGLRADSILRIGARLQVRAPES